MLEKISLAETNSLKTLRVNFAQSLQVMLEASYIGAILNTNFSLILILVKKVHLKNLGRS